MKLKRGEVGPALTESDQALQRYPSDQTEWHWRFRVVKAEALARQGLSKEALELLRMEPPASLATSDVAVRRKLVQGVASVRLQKAADAAGFLRASEDLARTYHRELLGEVLSAKAVVGFLAGDLLGAEKAYRESLQIAEERKDPFVQAAALGGLGLIATRREHYDESIDLDRAAIRLGESVGAQNTLAAVLGNTAWCYRELGDFENALTFYKQAEQVSAQNGQLGLRTYWLTGISNVYYQEHDYGSAEAVLAHALVIARQQANKRTLLEYLNALAEIALQTGQGDVAEKYFAEASDIAIASRSGLDPSQIQASTLIRARIEENRRDYARAEESFRRVIGDAGVDAAQKWEAQARLAQVYADEGQAAEADKEFRQSLATIDAVRSSVRAEDLRMSFLSGTVDFYDGYIAFLISQGRTQDALQVAELSRARTLAEGLGMASKMPSLSSSSFHPQQIAQRAKATLLFYWLGQSKSYLWVITPSKLTCLTLPGATEIDPLVKSYNDAVLGGRDVLAAGNADGMQLYKTLVEPAKKLISANSRVILLPDGSLYGLNFETLLVPEPSPHFWIEDVALSTANSLTLLSAARASRNTGNMLLVGSATQATPEFPVLRQADAEMADVGRYFPQARRAVMSGAQATPAAFLSGSPEKFAYIHFVTHGTASRAHPLDSAVILSPQGDSYKLYARDIVQHPLSAYLVTVSACNGSGTRAYSGEGLIGLSWAFLRAGAHNVIAALWEVNDASTPQLMDHLYAELSRGNDPATALRMAKLTLLHSDSVFKKPFYWAPFQLYSGS